MPEDATSVSRDGPEAETSHPTSTATAVEDAASLRERAEIAEKERDKYLKLMQRSMAEFENYQKRMQRDIAEERRYAQSDLARALLPVLDNLQQALDAGTKHSEANSIIEGVRLMQSQLLDTLGRFGVHRIDALGKSFDPEMHEAVSVEPRSDVQHGTITQVMEPGFRLHERLLRPAKVVVASGPGD
jgi:molecular chaperone GrpE